MTWPYFPPAIYTGATILYLADGPRGPEGDMRADYTVRDAETGELLELVEIHEGEFGGNEAPMRLALELLER